MNLTRVRKHRAQLSNRTFAEHMWGPRFVPSIAKENKFLKKGVGRERERKKETLTMTKSGLQV